MTEQELDEILEQHLNWLLNKPDGVRANLRGANLRGANLRGANLYEANLREADLGGADLYGANLRGADLSEADLYGAKLSGANLRGADLSEADLSGADLSEADLYGAKLSGAKLSGANLSEADLGRAKLRGADLSGADLSEADLGRAKDVPYIPMACPDEGSFIGWKRASGFIVKLLIPEDAKRSSATGRKCRCSKAVVLEIQNEDGARSGIDHCTSDYDGIFEYKVGEVVTVDNFYEDRWEECAPGIHFFINRQEAVDYIG